MLQVQETCKMSRGHDVRAMTCGRCRACSVPEGGDGAILEALTELVDALSGVGALQLTILIVVEATDGSVVETAKRVQEKCIMSP